MSSDSVFDGTLEDHSQMPTQSSKGYQTQQCRVSHSSDDSTTNCQCKQCKPSHSLEKQEEFKLQNLNRRIDEFFQKYEIAKSWIDKFMLLKNYRVVILCDDSGSMRTPVEQGKNTRWDELCDIVKIVFEGSLIFQPDGIDMYFINRPALINVKEMNQINEEFAKHPSGFTHIVPVLKSIFKCEKNMCSPNNTKLLVFVATDGVPTDKDGCPCVDELEKLIVNECTLQATHMMILLCTDDRPCVKYMREWDRKIENFDVTDDFHTERHIVRQKYGENYSFTLGDYVMKALVGAFIPEVDSLDDIQTED